MDKKMFWTMIENARENINFVYVEDYMAFHTEIVNKLADMEMVEIMKWQLIFFEYLELSYKEKLWAAAYAINAGCSDDWFDYFRAWLIAQGYTVFMNTLKDPDSLADVEGARENETFFEELYSVSLLAYHKKLGLTNRLENGDYDYDAFVKELEQNHLSDEEKEFLASEIIYDDEIDKEWDENSLKTLVPRLCKKFDW